MYTLEEIREGLQHYRAEEVAAGTGLSFNTVRRYTTGAEVNPRRTTLRLLSNWLDRQQQLASAT